jgi:hypothetical protein
LAREAFGFSLVLRTRGKNVTAGRGRLRTFSPPLNAYKQNHKAFNRRLRGSSLIKNMVRLKNLCKTAYWITRSVIPVTEQDRVMTNDG